jgi:hypothetical protein
MTELRAVTNEVDRTRYRRNERAALACAALCRASYELLSAEQEADVGVELEREERAAKRCAPALVARAA